MKKRSYFPGLLLFAPVLAFSQWVFNSFDSDPYWGGQVDTYSEYETQAIVSYVTDPFIYGTAAMRIDWGVTHDQDWGGGAYLLHLHPDSLGVYDFSLYDTLAFWYYNENKSNIPDAVHLRFNLCDVSDSPDGNKTYDVGQTEYWYSFHYILDDNPGWTKVALPLADVRNDPNGNGFERLGWYGIEGNDQLDLDMIKGFQMEFSISASEGDVALGTIILDNLILTSAGGDTMVFNSFDQNPYWGDQVDTHINYETQAVVSYVTDPFIYGTAAMRVDWGVTHDQDWGGGAYLLHLHPDSLGVYDFSLYDTLAFWYYNENKSNIPDAVHLRFNLCDVSDSPDGNKTYDVGQTEYWYSFHYILDDNPGWTKVALPLADVRNDPNGNGFERLGWYGIEGNDQLDLDMIKGFQMEFSISASEGDVALGTIILDHLVLYSGKLNSVKELQFGQPETYRLSQNYPNPFNASTRIHYTIPQPGLVELTLLDLMGHEIKTLVNEQQPAGDYTLNLDAGDIPSGIYFYQFIAGDFNRVRKMILVK